MSQEFFGCLSRRDWIRLTMAGALGSCLSGWLEPLAAMAADSPRRRRSCILLWMPGGPSQTDTFDLKPGHEHGGPFQEISTSVPGIRISEHLPKIAGHMHEMVLLRSMKTKEVEHSRATFHLRTGYVQQGPVDYPSFGSVVAKELGSDRSALPSFVSIAPYRAYNAAAFGAGFLGPQWAPLIVGEGAGAALKVPDMDLPAGVTPRRADARIGLLRELEQEFVTRRPGVAAMSHQTAYERAVRLMRSGAADAFNLDQEPAALQDAYGRSPFGRGCLLARRLVERGVPFVEVALSDFNGEAVAWDTHIKNFDIVKRLSGILDPAWSTLLADLKSRGLLESTLIVWMGEFGRTPKINPQGGREHYPHAWTTVLAGGGVHGGRVVGKTSPDGTTVEERPVAAADLLATVCLALGVDPLRHNDSNVGRPIRIVDKTAQPLHEILA
jgi:hypothetical protein